MGQQKKFNKRFDRVAAMPESTIEEVDKKMSAFNSIKVSFGGLSFFFSLFMFFIGTIIVFFVKKNRMKMERETIATEVERLRNKQERF